MQAPLGVPWLVPPFPSLGAVVLLDSKALPPPLAVQGVVYVTFFSFALSIRSLEKEGHGSYATGRGLSPKQPVLHQVVLQILSAPGMFPGVLGGC